MLGRLRRVFLAPLLFIHLALTSWFAIGGALFLAWFLFFASASIVLVYQWVEKQETAQQAEDAATTAHRSHATESFTRMKPALAASGVSGLSLALCMLQLGSSWPLAAVAAIFAAGFLATLMVVCISPASVPGR